MRFEIKILSLKELLAQGDRLMIPSWQRAEAWDRQRQQKLIDSILTGFPMPNFILGSLKGSSETLIVVDAQQRRAAIRDFMDGKFELLPSTKEDLRISKGFYEALPPQLLSIFNNYQIGVTYISDATMDQLKESFSRLQNGKSLTHAEKLNAAKGEFIDYCQRLTEHRFFEGSVFFLNLHKQYFKIAMAAVAIEVAGLATDLSPKTIARFAAARAIFPPDLPAVQNMNATINFLAKAFPQRTPALRYAPLVQSIIVLASKIVATGESQGREAEFGQFVTTFAEQYDAYRSPNSRRRDDDYEEFSQAGRQDRIDCNQTRHRILLKKMGVLSPALSGLLISASSEDQSKTSLTNIVQLPVSHAKIFGDLVSSYARRMGNLSQEKFTRWLANNTVITALYPKDTDRTAAIKRYIAFYNGETEPLASHNNLTHDAGVLYFVLNIPSADLEIAIPALAKNLIHTDAVRETVKPLARLMRHRGIYTLSALETGNNAGLFNEKEKPIVMNILANQKSLRDSANLWVLKRIETALKEMPENPALQRNLSSQPQKVAAGD